MNEGRTRNLDQANSAIKYIVKAIKNMVRFDFPAISLSLFVSNKNPIGNAGSRYQTKLWLKVRGIRKLKKYAHG